ncbi:EAL domain-containing protein [Telluria mixta]|uniref:EAL domain-containing protein n=1 Tax=Telluria mixta TaxID=34071 RepID=A0ABT2BSS3_9BURK|nr:EAL domain-containing protein [Telluria mixta]MCS0628168.1 EAL domain-containing protein [Telluria mixta]WEM93716.1 EAL domain-containing protein [Telluria mixta]
MNSIRKLRRGLVLFALILPLLYILSAGTAIVMDRRSTLAQAGSDMRNIAATLNEHALRTFGEADTRLRWALEEIERRHLSLSPADERDIHDILIAAVEGAPQASGLNVIDGDGWLRASNSTYPLQPIDSRDREYYAYLSTHPGHGMHISRSVRSRTNGKWSIPITRRVDRPDGSLKMIGGFGVDMAYFDRFYRTLRLGDSSRLMLLRRDGWVIMETPLRADVMDHNVAATGLFQRLAAAPSGIYETERSMIDGKPRLVGYASLPESDIVAVASVARAEVLQPWVVRSWEVAAIGAVSTLLLLGLLRFLWLRLADLEETQLNLTRRNAQLDAAHRRFQELVDGIDGVVWEAELPAFHFTYVSGNAEAISGYKAGEWIHNPTFWRDRLCTTPDGKTVEPVLNLDGPGLLKPVEHHLVTPDGREIWLRSNVMLAGSGTGHLQVRGITIDVTRQKQSELQLFQAVHVDPLTRLPNRRAFVDHLNHALALAERNGTMVALVLIDLDNFKTLNDTLGHGRGDQVLVRIGERLRDCIGPTDVLARMGGDEFAIAVEGGHRLALRAEHLAERIHAACADKVAFDDRELYLTLSMGIALYPQDGLDCQALVRSADTALYRAKAAGRNGWQFFDSSMARQVEHRLDLETGLRRAIDGGEFQLFYQPQRSLLDGRIVGAEALVRWDRPGRGMVPTQEFINVAEESGFIVALGNWVLRAACCQAADWGRTGLALRIAVNVSVVQLRQADFVDQVRHALVLSGLPPHRLELEITEGAFVADTVDAIGKLHVIKTMGVELAVDDFGTGYSSLSYLKQLPVDRLKIDQSFVRDLPHSDGDRAIVRAILAMAANLNLEVIAEGVESDEQVDFLRAEGCHEIQGFVLSPAINAASFAERFLAINHV